MSTEKTYTMRLVLGDDSGDGHGRQETITLSSCHPVEDVREAYKAACKLTGVTFHDERDQQGTNFTGLKRDWQESFKYAIATEYEEPYIHPEALEILNKFGFAEAFPNLVNTKPKSGKLDLRDIDEFVAVWIWFTNLGNPNLVLTQIPDTNPVINDKYWVGYALFE
jgi:hypothetical protein